MSLLVNRARMEGFVVFDFAKRYGEAVAAMAGWMAEGKLKMKEHVVEGGVDAVRRDAEQALRRRKHRQDGDEDRLMAKVLASVGAPMGALDYTVPKGTILLLTSCPMSARPNQGIPDLRHQ